MVGAAYVLFHKHCFRAVRLWDIVVCLRNRKTFMTFPRNQYRIELESPGRLDATEEDSA